MSHVNWTGSGKPVITHLKLWESLPLVAMARTCSWLCASSRLQRCFSSSWSWREKTEIKDWFLPVFNGGGIIKGVITDRI